MCYSKQFVLDWATLQNLAEENFGRGRAILARVPTEKASECEKWPYGPIEAVGNYGDVFLCSKSCEWVQNFTHGGRNTAPPVCLSSSAELFSLFRDCGTKTLLPALYFFVCLCWRKYPQTGSSASCFGLPSSPSCRRKRVVFSTPGRAFFHSETPDRALLAYLLQIFCRIFQLFLQFSQFCFVWVFLYGNGIPEDLFSSFVQKDFVLTTSIRIFLYFGWHKPHLPSIYSGRLLPRTSLLSFRVLFPVVLWPIQLRVCLRHFPKQHSGETLLLCAPECSETFL